MIQRLFFWATYVFGDPRWDTGVTPPEIVSLIEKEKLPPGRAIDLGCGTGTNAVYLAKGGWEVVGIDFIARPIRLAKTKAAAAGVQDRTKFLAADITRLDCESLGEFDLAIDIGCGHSLPQEARLRYVGTLARLIKPGGTLMLYMFRPTPERNRGLEPEDVEKLFSPSFQLTWSSLGEDTAAGSGSAWYRFVSNG